MAEWSLSYGAQAPVYLPYWSQGSANNKIFYFAGGASGSTSYSQMYKTYIYTPSTNTFSNGPDMRTPRELPRCVGLGNYVYCIGGRIQDSRPFYTYSGERINATTNTIETIANSNYRVSDEHGIAACNGEVYILGYYDYPSGNDPDDDSLFLQYIQVYNPSSNTWRTLTQKVPGTWRRFCSVGYGDNIYCCGGYDSIGERYDLKSFNTRTGAWTDLAACPAHIESDYNHLFTVGESLYVSIRGNLLEYDIASNRWITNSLGSNISLAFGSAIGSTFYSPVNDYWGDQTDRRIRILKIVYERTSIINPSPTQGLISEQQDNTFSWELEVVPNTSVQSSAEFNWRAGTSGNGTTHTITGTRTSYTVPAGTFPTSGVIQWRVRATAANGVTSAWTSWYTLNIQTKYMYVTSAKPQSGFQNEQGPIEFSWEYYSDPEGATQTGFEIQWQNTADTSNTNVIRATSSSTSYIVAANTFPNGSFRWRVRVTGNNEATSDFTPWYTISTVDAVPLAPTSLSPNYEIGAAEDGNKAILFTWFHNSPYGTAQRAYEVQLSNNEGASFTALSGKVTSSTMAYNAPANSINPADPIGRIWWRVRTYNSDDVAGAWSATASFLVEGSPAPPTWVSVESSNSFPLAQWVAPQQVSYQLEVLQGGTVIYATNRVNARTPSFRMPIPLKDGNYTFRVRIANSRYWSNWSNYSLTIRTTSRVSFESLDADPVTNGMRLSWRLGVSPPIE